MDSLHVSHSEQIGAELHLRYAGGVNVVVGRITRDYSKSPNAEVVIDVDARLAPEMRDRPPHLPRAARAPITLGNQGLC